MFIKITTQHDTSQIYFLLPNSSQNCKSNPDQSCTLWKSQLLIQMVCLLFSDLPFEVVKEGRILKNQTLTRPFVGVFLFCDSWAHSKSRSYNLKNCNFFFGASLVPGFNIKSINYNTSHNILKNSFGFS